MFNTVIVTILIYSTITFIISGFCDNEDVDKILAGSFVGGVFWLITYPLRKYKRNGFYCCEFYKDKDSENCIKVYTIGGDYSYNKLIKKYPEDEYGCTSYRITFKEYIFGKNKTV